MRIAVLGGGNGAHAMTADLTMGGHEVNMCELPEFRRNIAAAQVYGGIQLILRDSFEWDPSTPAGKEFTTPIGGKSGFAKITGKVTTDIAEAVKGVEIINLVVPAFGQEQWFERLIPHLQDGQMVVVHPGNFGSLVLRRMMQDRQVVKDVTVAETESLIYATNVVSPGVSRVVAVKQKVALSAFPATDTTKMLAALGKVFPEFYRVANVLEATFNNGNFVLHPPTMVCNAGQIEKLGPYRQYHYDVTPSVARVIEKVDEERIALGKALGLGLTTFKDSIIRYYGMASADDTLYQALCKTYGYRHTGPPHLKHRYLSEDVPFGLCPLSSFADELDVRTPTMDALIQLASVYNETDYWKESRTLQQMGLRGLDAKEILRVVNG